MLRIRRFLSDADPWREVLPSDTVTGLSEDTDYLIDVGLIDSQVFVDDVELEREGANLFHWRPKFYAGRVIAEVIRNNVVCQRFNLDVSPHPTKSGQSEFDAMVEEIRALDQTLLSGFSSGTMPFGREGREGPYVLDVLLTRLRSHGPAFIESVDHIVRSPHRFLAADRQVLPLGRVRRLHHSALRDRRIAALALGQDLSAESIESFQVTSATSTLTFDTPANRALTAMLRRLSAAVALLQRAVKHLELATPKEEQELRAERRLKDLHVLADVVHKLLLSPVFREVSVAETSAAGLTQISALPTYSKAYRLGGRALATQIEGSEACDRLHLPPSWGIYEVWCYLRIVACVAQILGAPPVERPGKAVFAERAVHFEMADGEWLEVLFQATFPSLKPTEGRLGWSVSGERRPDIVLVHYRPSNTRVLVFDAKWRSGRINALQAMQSAHIYHDALRICGAQPSSCLLLLPGVSAVPELEDEQFVQNYGVGAISSFRIGAVGIKQAQDFIGGWLESLQ